MVVDTGCPVRAGIGPRGFRVYLTRSGLPRASGDRPEIHWDWASEREVAPCERG